MIEPVHFVLKFSASYIETAPFFQIQHNNNIVVDTTTVNDCVKVEFDLELPINVRENHSITITRSGFDSMNEQLLRLDSITADGIDLEKICYTSKFYPEYPEPWASEQKEQGTLLPEFYTGWIEWGWNGVWELEFDTPFYTWLLESV